MGQCRIRAKRDLPTHAPIISRFKHVIQKKEINKNKI